MRRLDDIPIDPDVAASLEAIDAALAGEPVEPAQADLAELALLVAAERPRMSARGAEALDDRVRARFGARARRRSRPVLMTSLAAATAVVAIVVVTLAAAGGSSQPGSQLGAKAPQAASGAAARAAKAAPPAAASSTSSAAASTAPGAAASSAPGAAALSAPGAARKVIQSAQLQLSAPPNRVDQVAQEAFDVVGSVHGYVENSNVTQTGGSDGYASIELTVPAAALAQTMTELSRLPHAQVTSRTDGIQDVTSQYSAAQRRLADAQAHRAALLRQLGNAQSTAQVNSLNAQLRDADAAITAAQNALSSLTHQINTVQIGLTINTAAVPVAQTSSGFTIGKAAHDARRVLVVAAGVALIVLAALVPAALVAALVWWAGAALRRRRREHALDAA